MAILNKKNKAALFNPLSKDNPVIVQVLGICSCLAVTAKLEPAIVMGISVTAVTASIDKHVFPLQADNITYPQHYSQQHPNYRPAGGRCGFGHHSRPIPKSIQLRSKQAIIGIHWSYNHELHPDGAS